MSITTDTHTLQGPEADGGLSLTFVRAVPRIFPQSSDTCQKVSLVLLHGVASHKEVWFPTLEHLFDLQKDNPNDSFLVEEAWAMDVPSHGAAAVLNEQNLLSFPDGISGQQAARALQVLLKSGLLSQGSKVVGIGHSAGACVLIQSTAGYTGADLPYSSLILIEPAMMTREVLAQVTQDGSALTRIIDFARTRQDVWPSRTAAREWFAGQLPWSRWDTRVLDLYIEHALRDLPTAAYPDAAVGVTPATTRASEIAGYSHFEDAFDALEIMKGLSQTIPVHSVVGTVKDRIPAELHECVANEAEGRKVKSVRQVEGAGHHAVQEDPSGVAREIWRILQDEYGR